MNGTNSSAEEVEYECTEHEHPEASIFNKTIGNTLTSIYNDMIIYTP